MDKCDADYEDTYRDQLVCIEKKLKQQLKNNSQLIQALVDTGLNIFDYLLNLEFDSINMNFIKM